MDSDGRGSGSSAFSLKAKDHDIINKRAAIINIGGVTNLSQIIKRKIISTDIGPGNGIIDDLVNHFYKKKFDKDGYYASKGNIIKTGYIDIAMFLPNFSLINKIRWVKKKYTADGDYIVKCMKRNKQKKYRKR